MIFRQRDAELSILSDKEKEEEGLVIFFTKFVLRAYPS